VVATIQEIAMDKDRIVGVARQVKGAVKETVGRVTGDAKTWSKGPRKRQRGRCRTS
jgi:uncharacterized protein YjbJ (UPF0337 family)